jgi:hypothetical protein
VIVPYASCLAGNDFVNKKYDIKSSMPTRITKLVNINSQIPQQYYNQQFYAKETRITKTAVSKAESNDDSLYIILITKK